MVRTLHILTTCTKRKTAEVPPRLMLRNVRGRDLRARAEVWLQRIAAANHQKVEAGQLYCGDHWSVARSLVPYAIQSGFEAQLWVISTGYGLIPVEAEIAPYSATFSPTHPDSVGPGVQAFAQWWQRLAHWEGPSPGAPRTITTLARSDARAAFLVIASEAYLSAVRPDIEQAARVLRDPDRLVIVSAGTKKMGDLSRHLIPVDARLQADLGGARRALNIRMARRLLKETSPAQFRAEHLGRRYRRVLDSQPVVMPVQRKSSTDAEVAAFIAAAIGKGEKAPATRLLTRYRAQGRACEQKRFKRVYQQTIAAVVSEGGASEYSSAGRSKPRQSGETHAASRVRFFTRRGRRNREDSLFEPVTSGAGGAP